MEKRLWLLVMATPGVDDFMKAMMESPCGMHLQGIRAESK